MAPFLFFFLYCPLLISAFGPKPKRRRRKKENPWEKVRRDIYKKDSYVCCVWSPAGVGVIWDCVLSAREIKWKWKGVERISVRGRETRLRDKGRSDLFCSAGRWGERIRDFCSTSGSALSRSGIMANKLVVSIYRNPLPLFFFFACCHFYWWMNGCMEFYRFSGSPGMWTLKGSSSTWASLGN